MRFEFQDKVNGVSYCTSLSSKMQYLDDSNIAQILRSTHIVDHFDHQKLKDMADLLVDPRKMNIMVRSQSFGEEVNQVEEWYGTRYSVDDISPGLLDKILNPNVEVKEKKLGLPLPNNLIPKNFDLLPEEVLYSQWPILLQQWDNADLWYKKDDKFKRPKSKVSLRIYSNDCEMGKNMKAQTFLCLWALI